MRPSDWESHVDRYGRPVDPDRVAVARRSLERGDYDTDEAIDATVERVAAEMEADE